MCMPACVHVYVMSMYLYVHNMIKAATMTTVL